jgi:hypothetical protein
MNGKTVNWFLVALWGWFSMTIATTVEAQHCQPSDITLTTQAMVDTFQQDHGPCDEVGNLTIRGSDITNLSGLAGLAESTGNVRINQNPLLRGLDGLGAMTRVQWDFELTDNAALTEVDGLASLEYVGKVLRIERNPSLENLQGLSSLRTVRSYFYLQSNDALRSLQGLTSFEETLTFNIKYNDSLESLVGLDSLTGVNSTGEGKLGIRLFGNPKLLSLNGLENIIELRELFIQGGSLTNLEGLSGLRSIDLELIVQLTQGLESLEGLDSLESVEEVSLVSNGALQSVGALRRISKMEQLAIRTNPMLQTLDGLDSLLEVTGDVTILENPALNSCSAIVKVLDQIDDGEFGPGPPGLPDVGGNVLVGKNASGCNCILQVLEPGSGMFVLNPALTDAWFNPLHNGQGYFINLYSDLERIFVGWFTFETADRESYEPAAVIGEPYHRWLTASGDWTGTKATLDVTMTSGGVFDSSEPVENSPPETYGTVTIIFHSCDSATLSYNLNGITSGSTPIIRVSPDNVARCEEWSDYY